MELGKKCYPNGCLSEKVKCTHPKFTLSQEAKNRLAEKEHDVYEKWRARTGKIKYMDNSYNENPYYDDNLDLDQQSIEFWNNIG